MIVDLTKGEKVDGLNYDTWHYKIQYLFNEQKVLRTLTDSLEKPTNDTEQQARDIGTHIKCVKNNHRVHFTILSWI